MKLVYVNGYKIRQNLDPDFSIIHFNKPETGSFESKFYIPKNEIWFDKRFRREEEFLKKVLLTNFKIRKKQKPKNFIIKQEKKNRLKIQYVDGKIVREFIDPEFVMGGHDLIYKYIPAKTIWLDSRMDKRDIPHFFLHELIERKLMAKGKSYDNAHDYATAAEKESRRKAGGKYFGDYER